MEVKELNYLIAIAEEKSISRAAERLFMAQSSLSQFLKGLESELGNQLFFRTSTGVRPTESGRIMVEYAYRTLSEYHSARDQMQDIQELEKGRVLMGISTFRGTFLRPPVLNAFHMEYPGIHVEIIEENSMALEQLLQKGEIDLALLVLPVKHLKGEVEPLMQDEICLITRQGHPVLEKAFPTPEDSKSRIPLCIEIRDAMSYEFFLSDYDTILGREARCIFLEQELIPITHNEKLSAFFAASLGAAGLGLAFTYYSSHHAYPNAQFLSLGKEGRFLDLGLALPPGRYHSKAAMALRDMMLQVLKDV